MAHPASYLVATWESFPRVEWPLFEVDHSAIWYQVMACRMKTLPSACASTLYGFLCGMKYVRLYV